MPYFQNAEGAKLNFGLMLLLVLINSGISVIFSYVGRDFYSALSAKDQALFLEKTSNYAVGLAVATPLTVLYKFQRQRLALNWREWMTTELSRQYCTDKAYYKLEIDPEIDNPDQRLTEDVQAFTKVSLDFFITLMTAAIDLVSFSGILYSIYPNLFYAIFVYAGVGTLAAVRLGAGPIRSLAMQANLRYSLVRLRENAESIAFYRGEAQEEEEVVSRLGGAVENKRTQRNLEFFTVGYSYLIQILPVLVVSPLYFAGSVELGVITHAHLCFSFSGRLLPFLGLSSFSAGLGRLATFVDRMEAYQGPSSSSSSPATFQLAEAAASAEAAALSEIARGVGSRRLFSNVSVDVQPGRHLLVMGNSGTGKSSPAVHRRAVAGLWDRGSGDIARPHTADTMFLPQRPYCTLGSLRQQLVYPRRVDEWRAVQLDRLAERGVEGLDAVRDWGDELSLGEQQRLAFARVLVSKPRLAILDEATSALDLNNEAIMYKALAAVPGITYVSVGHRPSLLSFHASRLRLLGAGHSPCFEVEDLAEEPAEEAAAAGASGLAARR
ncbi:hypothetical protein EMIHUDRAFT_428064 [Emiliania huxleyi CCMP1516]|uniref:ABC transporter n=2 Tax=Emiliania huxleyi TaxID=2903 RepID=A0A0D3IGL9_EMIH1|nr:hypothetical protein EMIHUDRAFT_428064 [Emiliania huxleyi CCMP1516]EOD10404.1 hypothetical protein EMIHUDRAFT_428064 [Emiliania huxleyi CCMP1516]|eukprot:XP_005762833.1 hypothetical protein EMIHUDRAFT_428064 [Emiliania huxleyi CCMP1516]